MALKLNTNSGALVLPTGGTNTAAAQDIRDIRDPIPLGPNSLWLWITLAVVALATLTWWYSKRKKAPVVNPALLIPPHRRAKERLRAAHDLISDPYAFCSLVSDVIRLYLEERFNLHAPDRTTEEFLAELREGSQLNEDHKAVLENFLIKCDLVKFARVEPSEPELRDLLESAERLVDETREVAAPTTPTPEPAQK
jgi:hypothetical protein